MTFGFDRYEWSEKAMMRMTRALLVAGAALTVAGLLSCGGDSPAKPTPTTTTTTTTPTTTLPSAGECSPTPPPLYRIRLKVHDNGDGYRRILDSRPEVVDMNGYCLYRHGMDRNTCFTTREGDPQMFACDRLVVGRATDTGRWGPTWAYKANMGAPAQPCSPDAKPGCINDPNNQYLVIGKGQGAFQACVAADIPLSTSPTYPGSQCSWCQLAEGQGADKYCH
jgi:hypothetical protein